MNPSKKYPAKLLLFGEYTVLHGGDALAIPYSEYFGRWAFSPKGVNPTHDLGPFLNYLKSINLSKKGQLNTNAFAEDITNGLFFESTIPVGYGAGSSGSLCAAIWDRYGVAIQEVSELQAIFIEMESFFHGSSSGLDPLVSYWGHPILQQSSGITILPDSLLAQKFKVFDSGISRRTEPLVAWYKKQFEEVDSFREAVLKELLPLNTQAIRAIQKSNWDVLLESQKAISFWQQQYFKPLIPTSVQPIWEDAQRADQYFKICGAGGGGFFLYLPSS